MLGRDNPAATGDRKMNITKRLLVPLARRGNLGKSTFVALAAQWLHHHAIEWTGHDADSDHQSFSRLFPDDAKLVSLGEEPEGDLIGVFRRCGEAAVSLLDPRAHLSDAVIRTLQMIRFPEAFAEVGGRVLVAVFPSDDMEVMADLDSTIEKLGDRVDYLVVRNRARAPRTRMFDGSELEAEMQRLGALELEIPVLLAMARNHIAAHEARLQRSVSHAELVASKELAADPLIRVAVQQWLAGIFARLNVIAAHLLPAALAAKITIQQEAARPVVIGRGHRINVARL